MRVTASSLLITGDDAQSEFVSGRPNYVIIYGEGCFNSKRQARRSVELYEKYRSRVHFVAIDLDKPLLPDQQKLVKEYYKGAKFLTSWWSIRTENHFTTRPEKSNPAELRRS